MRVETLVVGAGPAGLQLAYYLQRQERSYVVLEAAKPGAFFERFPRHRKLISINKIHTGSEDPEVNLRWDWNSLLCDDPEFRFAKYTQEYFPAAGDLVQYFQDFAERYELQIRCDAEVERVSRQEDGTFLVWDRQGRRYEASQVVIATGVSQPYLPDVPGIELAEPYTEMSTDLADFAGQRVLILGKGNSAFETADHLIPAASLIHLLSENSVRFAWQTHFVGHLRAVNNNFLDTYQLKSQNALLDAKILSVEQVDGRIHVQVAYAHANGEIETLVYDRMLACTGFRFDASIFDEDCRPELTIDDRFPAQTSSWESVNIPGLFFAGVLTQARDYKKTTSAFIHGFRYNSQALFHILEQRNHGVPWPSRQLDTTPEKLRDAVIERVNRSSGLWQQFGFLGDVIVVDAEGKSAHYYEDVPLDYFHAGGLGQNGNRCYAVTLEYGSDHLPDPFKVERIARDEVDKAEESQFLHPIVRCFTDGRQLAEHHVIEDLESHWVEDVHREPLLEFFHLHEAQS